MAIIPLDLHLGLTLDEVKAIALRTKVNGQGRNEIYQCWDILLIWRDWIEHTFGHLSEVRHLSQNDDPPDLELEFADGRVIQMEHTRLQPPHLGQAAALLNQSPEGGLIPPIAPPPQNFAELQEIIFARVRPRPGNVIEEWRAVVSLLITTLQRKMAAMPSGGLIAITHDLFISKHDHELLGEVAQSVIERPELADFEKYTLLLLNRFNFRQFYSSLIKRGQTSRFREGT
jgi:hypothetical protein